MAPVQGIQGSDRAADGATRRALRFKAMSSTDAIEVDLDDECVDISFGSLLRAHNGDAAPAPKPTAESDGACRAPGAAAVPAGLASLAEGNSTLHNTITSLERRFADGGLRDAGENDDEYAGAGNAAEDEYDMEDGFLDDSELVHAAIDEQPRNERGPVTRRKLL